MRSACLTLAATLLATACGDDGNMPTSTNDTTPPNTSGATDDTTPPTTAETPTSEGTAGTAEAGDTDETTAASGDNLMTNYGAPCKVDADCKGVLDDSAVCVLNILGVYDLPGGYCSTNCMMPADMMTTSVSMAPDCLLGADCVGLDGFFEACSFPCTDDSQCQRADYECRQLPQIAAADDPKYCLMTEESQG